MDVSVIVPLLNEEESLPELNAWIQRILTGNNFSYEIIYVDDGSTDGSWQTIESFTLSDDRVKGIKFRRNYGKSAALSEAFRAATGDTVITMDADMQDSPDEIPALYKMMREEKWDLVSGWKKIRHDPISKTIPSRLFNGVTRWMSGIRIHDFNCGLKAYRLDVIKGIEIQGEMHRYIPVIAKLEGFSKISEKVVVHRARKYGKSKFGWERFVNGFLDLLSILFIARFGKKPMHLFGSLGLISFFIGFLILLDLSVQKIIYHVYKITELPVFYLGLLAIVLGVQLFSVGFVAELIARLKNGKEMYQVEKRVNFS